MLFAIDVAMPSDTRRLAGNGDKLRKMQAAELQISGAVSESQSNTFEASYEQRISNTVANMNSETVIRRQPFDIGGMR